VVRAEQQDLRLPKRATFFSVANPDDLNTQASTERLVKPLADKLRGDEPDWTLETVLAEDAKKGHLESLLKDNAPALLFTASHGAGFDLGDPRQLKHQGALVCQEWQGPVAMKGRPVPQSMYYAMDDVTSDAQLHGSITFHFACFGAGTPRYDEFTHLKAGMRERTQIAPSSFLARLPKKLLGHPKGGTLAVIGHVDRAWGSSFLWNKSVEQLSTFESALVRLMNGYTVGAAMEYFNQRYAELASTLSSDLEDMRMNKKVDALELATTWTANNDARGYTVIGDPAVRLRVGTKNGAPKPELTTLTLNMPALPDATDASPAGLGSVQATTAETLGRNAPLDAALEKLEQQLAALAETIQELRAAIKKE
jgi:hypothetical protein